MNRWIRRYGTLDLPLRAQLASVFLLRFCCRAPIAASNHKTIAVLPETVLVGPQQRTIHQRIVIKGEYMRRTRRNGAR